MLDHFLRGMTAVVLAVVPIVTNWELFSNQGKTQATVLIRLPLGVMAVVGVCPIYQVFGFNTEEARA